MERLDVNEDVKRTIMGPAVRQTYRNFQKSEARQLLQSLSGKTQYMVSGALAGSDDENVVPAHWALAVEEEPSSSDKVPRVEPTRVPEPSDPTSEDPSEAPEAPEASLEHDG